MAAPGDWKQGSLDVRAVRHGHQMARTGEHSGRPAGGRTSHVADAHKLMIFTEPRDTLEYLAGKIRQRGWGAMKPWSSSMAACRVTRAAPT